MATIIEEVKKEMDEMKKIGMRVPKKAYTIAERDADELRQGGMRISEIADLCIQLC